MPLSTLPTVDDSFAVCSKILNRCSIRPQFHGEFLLIAKENPGSYQLKLRIGVVKRFQIATGNLVMLPDPHVQGASY